MRTDTTGLDPVTGVRIPRRRRGRGWERIDLPDSRTGEVPGTRRLPRDEPHPVPVRRTVSGTSRVCQRSLSSVVVPYGVRYWSNRNFQKGFLGVKPRVRILQDATLRRITVYTRSFVPVGIRVGSPHGSWRTSTGEVPESTSEEWRAPPTPEPPTLAPTFLPTDPPRPSPH